MSKNVAISMDELNRVMGGSSLDDTQAKAFEDYIAAYPGLPGASADCTSIHQGNVVCQNVGAGTGLKG